MRQWLIDIRNKKQLTQDDVAKSAEVTRPYITSIESGDRRPSVQVAKRIATTLGFEWTLFFDLEGNETLHDKEVRT